MAPRRRSESLVRFDAFRPVTAKLISQYMVEFTRLSTSTILKVIAIGARSLAGMTSLMDISAKTSLLKACRMTKFT